MRDLKARAIRRRITVLAVVLVALVALALPFVAGSVYVRPFRHAIGPPPRELNAEPVAFASASGATLRGWFAQGKRGTGAVLLLHGVHADRRIMVDRARFLARAGYTVLLFDFQAHGESTGDLITFGRRESLDVRSAVEYVRLHAPGERIGVIGVSLGGAATVLATPPLAIDALVLESVHPTIEKATANRLAAALGPLAPALTPLLTRVFTWQLQHRWSISPNDLRPIDRINTVQAPVFVLTGDADRFPTLEESRALFMNAPEPKEFWAVPRATHVDLFAVAGVEYERRVLDFLQRYLRESQ